MQKKLTSYQIIENQIVQNHTKIKISKESKQFP